jgi:hypothetical protein
MRLKVEIPQPRIQQWDKGFTLQQDQPSDINVLHYLVVVGFPDALGKRPVIAVQAAALYSTSPSRHFHSSLADALAFSPGPNVLNTVIDPITALNLGIATPEDLNMSEGVKALFNLVKGNTYG